MCLRASCANDKCWMNSCEVAKNNPIGSQFTHSCSSGIRLWVTALSCTLNEEINSAEGVNDNFVVAMVTFFLLACILDTA